MKLLFRYIHYVKQVKEFNEKRYIKENAPYVKLNMDETKGYYYNYVTGFVEVYSVDDFSKTIHAAEMQNIDFFQISPKQEFIVGCFLEVPNYFSWYYLDIM